jgi:chemotaxis protein MotB
MKRKFIMYLAVGSLLTAGCVSQKKYNELENKYNNTTSQLQKTRVKNEELSAQVDRIQARVDNYNEKINSLRSENEDMLVKVEDVAVMSKRNKEQMRKMLKNVPENRLREAKTFKDSMDLAISYKMNQKMGGSDADSTAVDINIDDTVVMLNIADDLLFRSSSYSVSSKADDLLERLANVLKSEPSLEIMVEGHTDDLTVKEGSYVKDNWDLSTERAGAIVRRLEEKFGVPPEQMIIAGRGSHAPLVDNDSNENRAKNRRTRIIIMPNLDKFLAMITDGVSEDEQKMKP